MWVGVFGGAANRIWCCEMGSGRSLFTALGPSFRGIGGARLLSWGKVVGGASWKEEGWMSHV